ncbi:IS110 family transposase [Enterococcus faecalis]|uniref:IS110 family transposase n=1 Tax=Enterococcus faecalis TaxID=1351 RepID=UPI001E3BA3C9|nr:IS110 family transposase [Enterococcus faecalis]
MIYIGIDVARKKHDICILDQFSTVLLDGLTITMTRLGLRHLLKMSLVSKKKQLMIRLPLPLKPQAIILIIFYCSLIL